VNTQVQQILKLRESRPIRAKIMRLWDLMTLESAALGAAVRPPVEVENNQCTLEGYQQMHIRLAKVLTQGAIFGEEMTTQQYNAAIADADKDWEQDCARFAEASHIVHWFEQLRAKFRTAARQAVATVGFTAVFARYDADGSGELDLAEFTQAVRQDLKVEPQLVSDKELGALFTAVDGDGSGEIDATEFVKWLWSERGVLRGRTKTIADNRRKMLNKTLPTVKTRFKEAAEHMTETTGWPAVFEKYDDDGSGELDIREFTQMVRNELQLQVSSVGDDELRELYGVVDADGSGAIDASELLAILQEDLTASTMTFEAFYSAMFELATVWVPEENEEQYISFLQGIFDVVSMPVNGHTYDEELSAVPVFDGSDVRVANFRFRPFKNIMPIVAGDGLKADMREMAARMQEEMEREQAEAEAAEAARLAAEAARLERERLAEEARRNIHAPRCAQAMPSHRAEEAERNREEIQRRKQQRKAMVRTKLSAISSLQAGSATAAQCVEWARPRTPSNPLVPKSETLDLYGRPSRHSRAAMEAYHLRKSELSRHCYHTSILKKVEMGATQLLDIWDPLAGGGDPVGDGVGPPSSSGTGEQPEAPLLHDFARASTPPHIDGWAPAHSHHLLSGAGMTSKRTVIHTDRLVSTGKWPCTRTPRHTHNSARTPLIQTGCR
jgi:Ca2+-binding EF-hand superfamily protein